MESNAPMDAITIPSSRISWWVVMAAAVLVFSVSIFALLQSGWPYRTFFIIPLCLLGVLILLRCAHSLVHPEKYGLELDEFGLREGSLIPRKAWWSDIVDIRIGTPIDSEDVEAIMIELRNGRSFKLSLAYKLSLPELLDLLTRYQAAHSEVRQTPRR